MEEESPCQTAPSRASRSTCQPPLVVATNSISSLQPHRTFQEEPLALQDAHLPIFCASLPIRSTYTLRLFNTSVQAHTCQRADAMCKYRYYYYAGCRHQETVLHDYCDKATSAPASSSAHTISPATTLPPSHAQAGGAHEDQDATPRARSPANVPSPSPTMSTSSSSHHTTASNVSIGSSAPTSFASSTGDTPDTSSIQFEEPHRRHSEPSECNMASLPPFVRDNLRQFFSGGQITTPPTGTFGDRHVNDQDQENLVSQCCCLRQVCKADNAQQPIETANQNRHSDSAHAANTTKLVVDRLSDVVAGKNRNASYSSVESTMSESEFDAIERDIDTLKQQVAGLRSGSRSGRSAPTGVEHQTQSKSSSTRTRIPGPVAPPKESAAARLQREHEKAHEQHTRSSGSHQAKPPPPPPSPCDFPELAQSNTDQRPRAFTADANRDKPSYANMATTGMMDALSRRFAGTEGTHSQKMCSSGSASRSTRGSFTSSSRTDAMATEGQMHTASAVSPECERSSASKDQTSSLAGRSPRFAQPTKTYTQRADATTRKDSVTSRVSPAGSPTKSSRALPQLQTKRSALPGGWLSSPEVSPTTHVSTPSINGTVDASSPSSNERWQFISQSSKETATNAEPTLRKKTSSYMSPTKATTLRNVATLGQENIKHTSPRVKKSVTRIDTKVSPSHKAMNSANSHQPDSAISGTTSTESYMSSPDVAILTEGRAINPWNLHQTHVGEKTLVGPTPTSFEPAIRAAGAHDRNVLPRINTVLPCGVEEVQSSTSDPASALFGHVELQNTSIATGECVKTERSLGSSRGHEHPELAASRKQTATNKSIPSSAVPIVRPHTSMPEPMPRKLHAARQSTTGSLGLVVDDLAAKAKARGLPMPANTVAKRRVSHGHLLIPITSKLDSLGLLRQPAAASSPATSQATPFSTAQQQVRQLLPQTPHMSPPLEPRPVPAAPRVRTKAVPPHLRRKHNTSSADEPTELYRDATGSNDNRISGSACQDFARSSQVPSLRATAQEFTPKWKPKTIEQELGLLDWEGWFSYRSPEEWNALHPGIRAAIQAIREYKCKGGRPPSGTFPGMSPTKIRSKTANQRFWANLMQNQTPTSNSDSSINMSPGDVVAAMQESIAQYGASGNVEAGQVLKPEINPETNAIQWVMQEPDGRKVSVTFGRAAAPAPALGSCGAFDSPSTVTISPNSLDSSQRYNAPSPEQSSNVFRTPSGNHNRRGWSIASALRDPTGWAIGDGREIRYVGNGNANTASHYSPVAPSQQGVREGPDQAPRMIGDEQDSGSGSIPLAPRSREQWAKLLPQTRMPCGNIEVTDAIEQIPMSAMDGAPLYGFCGPCSGKTH